MKGSLEVEPKSLTLYGRKEPPCLTQPVELAIVETAEITRRNLKAALESTPPIATQQAAVSSGRQPSEAGSCCCH